MKIEKLTENKIRIIVNLDDLKEKNIDLHTLMSNPLDSQNWLVELLHKAEKEVGFNTENCKNLIEALATPDGLFVFTITKFKPEKETSTPKNKTVCIKRKTANLDTNNAVYSFESFEEFCNYCSYVANSSLCNLKDFSKNMSLYLYNDVYYLSISDINLSNPNLKNFYATISEFAKLVTHSNNFERKLLEHGKVIIKKNAIKKGIDYFCNIKD